MAALTTSSAPNGRRPGPGAFESESESSEWTGATRGRCPHGSLGGALVATPAGHPPLVLHRDHVFAALHKLAVGLGTHQGSVDEAHLQGYLNEFVFRFNRRGSRSRGLVFHRVLELAEAHDPVRYRDLVVNPQPKAAPPVPPGIRGHPPSMDRPRAARPWRAC
jgi:hypothetical protein